MKKVYTAPEIEYDGFDIEEFICAKLYNEFSVGAGADDYSYGKGYGTSGAEGSIGGIGGEGNGDGWGF